MFYIAPKEAFSVLKHFREMLIFQNKFEIVIMKKLLILLLFSNFINAQVEPANYPVFENCKNITVDKLRDCFLNELHNELYENLEGKLPDKGTVEQVQVFFSIDEEGYFKHRANSATSEIVSNTIASAFKDLPRVKPARFLGEPASEKFGIILKIPLQRNGSLSEIITSAAPPPPPAPEIIAVVEDNVEIEEVIIEIEDPEVLSYTENMEVEETLDENEPEKVPFAIIQEAPIYPGCEGDFYTNAERKKCTSEKITRFVNQEFDQSIALELGLEGRQSVIVMYTIDNEGRSTDIKTRTKHPELASEAIRVIQKLPKMIPGKQEGKTVNTIYALPIIFTVSE